MTDAADPPDAAERGDWRRPVLLALLVAALALALWVPYARSLAVWTDELYSLRTAEEPPGEMVRNLRQYRPYYYDHPPLYFLILHSALLVSSSPLAIRLYSLLFGAAAVWIVAAGPQRRGGLLFCAAVAVLLSLHPMIRNHATQARTYALDLMLAAAAVSLLLVLPAAPPRRAWSMAALLGILVAAIVYTSYHAAFFAAGVGALGLAWTAWPRLASADSRRPGFMVLFACAIAGVLLLPWAPVFLSIPSLEEGFGFRSEIPRPVQIREAVVGLCGSKAGLAALIAGWIVLFSIGRERLRAASVLASCAILPMTALAAATPETRVYLDRYLIFAIPALFEAALAGWESAAARLADRAPSRARLAAAGAAIVALLPAPFFLLRSHQTILAPVPDWWGAAAILERNAKPGEKVLTGGYLSGEAVDYHLREPQKFELIHNQTQIDPFYVWCRNPSVVWYVNCAPLPKGFHDIVRHYFPYSVTFRGNRDLGRIMVYAKRPFPLPWGGDAEFNAPKPLDFEERARQEMERQQPRPKEESAP